MAFLKVNDKKKTITIDRKEVPTEVDKLVFESLVMAGYTVRYKSEKRAENARKRFKKKKDEAKAEAEKTEAKKDEEKTEEAKKEEVKKDEAKKTEETK